MRRPLTALALTTGRLLTACGSTDADDPAAAGAPSAPAASVSPSVPAEQAAADVTFAGMMVPHHHDQGGVEMTQLAVQKAADEGTRAIAQASLQDQQAEKPQLQQVF